MSNRRDPSHHRTGRRTGNRPAWEPLPGTSLPPTPAREILDQLASTMGLSSVAGINRLFLGWSDVVGEHLATKCSPKRLSDGILVIEAADQQWITELSWMTAALIERCNDALGPGEVIDVKVVRKSGS